MFIYNPVAVSGMGIYSSIGCGIKAFSESLFSGKNNFTYVSPGEDLPSHIGIRSVCNFKFEDECKMFLNTEPERTELAYKMLRRRDKVVQSVALAAIEAWKNAGLDDSRPECTRIGLVVAGSNLNMESSYSAHTKYNEMPMYMSPSYALQFMDTDYAGTLSEIFGINGEILTVGGASASGNSAVIKAFQMLELGIADVCMVVAPMTVLSNAEWMSFANLGALGGTNYVDHPEAACRPFDKAHEGFIPGEASVCVILETMTSLKKRCGKASAMLIGGAITADGNHLSNPSKDGELRAMRMAVESAGITVNDIDYINAHCTSTPMGDEIETAAIIELLGDQAERVWVNSTKSITGHGLFSAGLIEMVASVIELDAGKLHPNLNLDTPITDRLRFCPSQAINEEFYTVMSNSFGFGGINTSIILKGIKK